MSEERSYEQVGLKKSKRINFEKNNIKAGEANKSKIFGEC